MIEAEVETVREVVPKQCPSTVRLGTTRLFLMSDPAALLTAGYGERSPAFTRLLHAEARLDIRGDVLRSTRPGWAYFCGRLED